MATRLESIAAATALLAFLLVPSAYAATETDAQDVMLVLDNSGSMHKIDPDFSLRGAIERFVGDADAQQRLGIVIYDKDANVAAPLAPHTAGLSGALLNGLNQINYRGRYTNTAAGIERGIQELKTHGREGAGRAVILLTDGVIDTGDKNRSSESARWLREELAADAARNTIPVYTIALGTAADYQLLHSLAEMTQGGYFRADRADEISAAFTEIGTALRHRKVPAAVPAPETVPQPEPITAQPDPVVPVDSARAPEITEPDPASQDAQVGTARTVDVATEIEPVTNPVAPKSWLQNLAWVGEFPYRWLLGISLAFAAVEGALFLRRKRRAKQRSGRPSLYPPPVAGDEFVPEAFLQDMTGVLGKESFPLTKTWTLIGRQHQDDTNDVAELVIASSTIGRQHATVQYRDHGFWLNDRRSRNGTYVNGNRITDPVCLKHGDVIRFHDFEFRFLLGYLTDSDETVIASHLSQWHLDPTSMDHAIPTLAIAKRAANERMQPAEPQPPIQSVPRPSLRPSLDDTELLEDITLPSDDAVRKALDKYFEATNY
jgi:Mg-chelatase subunit ChlD